MPTHYIDKSDWRDRLFQNIMLVLSIPIGFILRLFLGDSGKNE